MRILAGLTALVLTAPAHAANAALYDWLEASDQMRQGYVATRTKTGVNFNSKARVDLPGIPEHPRRHIEIEGPSMATGSLDDSLDAVIAATEPEVDKTYRADENTRHGLNITQVDVNGVDVAFLSYRSAREADASCRRALIHTPKGDYVVTMSMHGAVPRDRAGMALDMLVIEMVNSGLLTRTEPSWLRRFVPAQ